MEIIVDPLQVLYSQCCVKPTFKNGELVENTIRKLVYGILSPSDIEPIHVCILPNGDMHSLDNRRLYAFKEAIRRGSAFRAVIAIRSYNLDSLQWKMSHPPSKDWSVVTVKYNCKPIFSVYTTPQQNTAANWNIDSVYTTPQQNTAVNWNIENDNLLFSLLNNRTRTQDTVVNNTIEDDSSSKLSLFPHEDNHNHVENTGRKDTSKWWCVIS